MLQDYSVTFSGTDDPDPLHAAFGNNVVCHWSDSFLVEAKSKEDAISQAKRMAGQQLAYKKYETEVEIVEKKAD